MTRGSARRHRAAPPAHLRIRRLLRALADNRLMDSPPPVATSRTLAAIGSTFYVSGGVISAATAATDAAMRHRLPVVVIAALAVVAGLLVARFSALIPQGARIAMNFFGTGLVLLIVLLAGPGVGGHTVFWLFCYVPIDSFLFFAWRWAVPMLGWGLCATWIAAFPAHVVSRSEWCATSLIGLVVSLTVGWLVRLADEGGWDPATDMLNRRGFDAELRDRCFEADRSGHRFSLATIKVEAAEELPADEANHSGELVVRRLAARWRRTRPAPATWARLRDFEFAVLWDDSPGFDAYLEDVRRAAVAERTVSIGVCDVQPGHTPVQMLTDAMAGRTFSERVGGDRVSRAGLVTEQVDELRAAVANGQVVPFYQPLVDLATGRVIGAEALARWLHPGRGMIGPDVFVPVAEQAGLIRELGAQMLRHACTDAASWSGTGGAPLKVSVNVSGEQLHDPEFPQFVGRCLAGAGLSADRLTLEVTESTVAGDDPRAHAALRRLRARGITIAMDDFGTGYSNLSRLATLPIDVLKIDQSFVAQLADPGRARALATGLVHLANGLGLAVVVEGIELPEQRDFLRGTGAEVGQGWLFGRPVPEVVFRSAAALLHPTGATPAQPGGTAPSPTPARARPSADCGAATHADGGGAR